MMPYPSPAAASALQVGLRLLRQAVGYLLSAHLKISFQSVSEARDFLAGRWIVRTLWLPFGPDGAR